MNYYIGDKDHPQHLSVGAVMRNAEGLIRVHYFPAGIPSGFWKKVGVTDFYILMRTTLTPGESLEQALTRGLAEEFDAVATIDDYLGSITSTAYDDRTGEHIPFQKTTLYFLCTYQKEAGTERNMADAEGQSLLEWKSAPELIPIMKAQGAKFGRNDIDESGILELYLTQVARGS